MLSIVTIYLMGKKLVESDKSIFLLKKDISNFEIWI